MTDLVYRGTAFDSEQNKINTETDKNENRQSHSSELIYRGSPNHGVRVEGHTEGQHGAENLIYRGIRQA